MPFASKSYEQFHVVMCTGGLGSHSYDSCCCVFCLISFLILLCWARGLFWSSWREFGFFFLLFFSLLQINIFFSVFKSFLCQK
jgi:hypothetical protein